MKMQAKMYFEVEIGISGTCDPRMKKKWFK